MADNESATENVQPQASGDQSQTSPSESTAAGAASIEEALSSEVGRLVTRIDELTNSNSELQKKLTDQEQLYVRLMADFENFRKRTQREKDELASFVTAKLLADILPVLDNFDRARNHVQVESEREEKLHNSYQQVHRQFLGILEKLGVQPIEVVGHPFDPALHEAILRDESPDVAQETVVAELQKGYQLGERILRPAMVKVAVPTAPPPPPQPTPD